MIVWKKLSNKFTKMIVHFSVHSLYTYLVLLTVVGVKVGSIVGNAVGSTVGNVVGSTVGFSVGRGSQFVMIF